MQNFSLYQLVAKGGISSLESDYSLPPGCAFPASTSVNVRNALAISVLISTLGTKRDATPASARQLSRVALQHTSPWRCGNRKDHKRRQREWSGPSKVHRRTRRRDPLYHHRCSEGAHVSLIIFSILKLYTFYNMLFQNIGRT